MVWCDCGLLWLCCVVWWLYVVFVGGGVELVWLVVVYWIYVGWVRLGEWWNVLWDLWGVCVLCGCDWVFVEWRSLSGWDDSVGIFVLDVFFDFGGVVGFYEGFGSGCVFVGGVYYDDIGIGVIGIFDGDGVFFWV